MDDRPSFVSRYRVHGGREYLYRAIGRDGALVDVMLSEHRDLAAEGLLSIG
jgi:transposase-like protein